MEWMLIVVLMGSPDTLGASFATEAECVREMRLTIRAMEKEGEKIDHVSCTPGIVVSAIDDE
jgi:hypothetical protein